MKYTLSVRLALQSSSPIVVELSAEDGRLPVKHWLDSILQQPADWQMASIIASMRSLLAQEDSAILAEVGSRSVRVELERSIADYASEDPASRSGHAQIRLVVSFAMGSPPLTTGGEDLLADLDIREALIQGDIPPTFEDRLALVLGGGGAKGAAQAGAIKAVMDVLDEVNAIANMGAKVHYVLGSSIGAFNALFVASKKMEALEDFWMHVHPLTGLNLIRELRRRVPKDGLSIPVEVSKVNLQTGRAEFAGPESLDIFDEVRKSMRIPPIFPAVRSGGAQYVDGGVLVNLPVARCLDKRCYWIIVIGLETASDLRRRYWWPVGQAKRALELQGKELQRFQRLFLLVSSQMRRLIDLADLDRCKIDDLMFISSIRRHLFTWNVIVVPLEEHISASTIRFSRRRCQEDFREAYGFTKQYLGGKLLPLASRFAHRHSPASVAAGQEGQESG